MTLFYQHYGDGFPLLILHGFLGAGGNWHTLSRTVFAQRFATYAIDQRNHGRSPHDDAMSYPLMAGDLLAFMEAHAMPRAHLLGHSMGGKVAMAFALAHPERVGRLVVADIAPKAYPPHHQPILDALRRLDLPGLGTREAIDRALAADIASVPIRQFLLKNLLPDGDGGYRWKMNLDALHANYAAINAPVDAARPFEGPALFVRGGASNYVADADVSDIRRLFPAADLVTLPGAGHWLHAEAPDAFAETVVSFLDA